MADQFQQFMNQTLQPGVLRYGRRKLDVRRLSQVSPPVLRSMDDDVNDDLFRLETTICRVDSDDQRKTECFNGRLGRDLPHCAVDQLHGEPTKEILHVLAVLVGAKDIGEPMEVRMRLARKLVATLRERRVRAEQRGQDWQ